MFGNQSKSYLEKIARQGANSPVCIGHETLVVSGTAQSLVGNANATDAIIQIQSTVATTAVRYWEDGTAPTSSAGFSQGNGAVIELTNQQNIVNFKIIKETAGTTSIVVSYYK